MKEAIKGVLAFWCLVIVVLLAVPWIVFGLVKYFDFVSHIFK